MTRLSRSRFLSAAAAAAALPLVEWVRPVRAQAAPAKLSDIDHIVILMQENRSFDHYFGSLSGVRGFGDASAVLFPDGRPVFYQPSTLARDGYVLPFHLDTKTTSAQQLHDLSHAWRTLHESWNGGRQDGFVTAHYRSDGASGPLTMGYYTRDDIPFHYALADAFTICDGYHASLMGPTNPNRYYWMTAAIHLGDLRRAARARGCLVAHLPPRDYGRVPGRTRCHHELRRLPGCAEEFGAL